MQTKLIQVNDVGFIWRDRIKSGYTNTIQYDGNRVYVIIVTASNKWFRHHITNGNITAVLDYTHEVSVDGNAGFQYIEAVIEKWKLHLPCYVRNNQLICLAKFRNEADEFLFKCANPLFNVNKLIDDSNLP